MPTIRRWSVSALALLLTGCLDIPLPMGTHLAESVPVGTARPQAAWVDRVVVDGLESAAMADGVGDSLTLHLADYLRGRKMFERVMILPGQPAPQDTVLHLRFTRYDQESGISPWYFPAAVLTLTVYIWVGGTVGIHHTNYAATLTVDDGAGHRQAEVSLEEATSRHLSVYSDTRVDFGPARSKFVDHLLDRALGGAAPGTPQP